MALMRALSGDPAAAAIPPYYHEVHIGVQETEPSGEVEHLTHEDVEKFFGNQAGRNFLFTERLVAMRNIARTYSGQEVSYTGNARHLYDAVLKTVEELQTLRPKVEAVLSPEKAEEIPPDEQQQILSLWFALVERFATQADAYSELLAEEKVELEEVLAHALSSAPGLLSGLLPGEMERTK
jgi:hypothetical protein